MKKYFISTGGFKNQYPSKTIEHLVANGFRNIELSGGLYEDSILDKLISFSEEEIDLSIHNYFPAPKMPFVLNLASLDDEIFKKSFNHIEKSIELASKMPSKFYSFHAAYLIDPCHKTLGKEIPYRKTHDREASLELFLNSVSTLNERALNYGVKLYIENNVLTKTNLLNFAENPLLMVDPEEINFVMRETPNNVSLLVDLAHLKVSANTLGLDKNEFLDQINPFAKAYHLSDNEGMIDNNMSFDQTAWFYGLLKNEVDFVTTEVYSNNIDVLNAAYNVSKEEKMYTK